MKKIISVLLCTVLIIISVTACSGKAERTVQEQNEVKTTIESKIDTSSFRLSYSKADSLNPFESKTLNNQVLQSLVYESLFYVDESYEAQPLLAENYTYTDSKTLVVTLKSDVYFSDGTQLDSENVEYSFKQAKDSPHWENALKNFSSVSVEGGRVVEFKLKTPNINAHKLLTFAIARADDNEEGFRAGTGRYKFENSEGEISLVVNEKKKDFTPNIIKISLVNITSAESIVNAINIGNISYAFRDLSEGSKLKVNTSQKTVLLNNLVYLGIYGKSGITADFNVRKAINLAIDREEIIKSAYRGYGKSALSIFNPNSAIARETQMFSPTADTEAAAQALAGAQLDRDKKNELTLVCSKNENAKTAAKLVKQQLEAAGFEIKLQAKKKSEYLSAVRYGNFDLYIGETKLPGDLGLQSFFDEDGETSYGIDLEDEECAKSYGEYLEGESEIGKFIIDFSQELPFIPLLYRQGMICYSKSLKGDIQGYDGNCFSNIEDWYYS